MKKKRILIADDDTTGREILASYLTQYGECVIAKDGTETLKLFIDALNENNRFDFICLDIMMPGMTGTDVLRRIRQLEDERDIIGIDKTKVVMISAVDDSRSILESFVNQCAAYIGKPFPREKLINTLKELGLTE